MFEGFDQDELLAYVEDGLDPARTADLRRRLAAHPQVQRALDRLRQDRELLRSLEAPAAPPDLMAELEPMLARPMLMPRPADWRRRYRPRRRWPLLAAVACLGLLVPAALWALSAGWLARPAPVELAQTRPEVTQPRPAPGPTTVAPDMGPTSGGGNAALDDRHPTQQVAGGTRPGGTAPAPRAPRSPGEPPRFAPAEFLLVVRAADESSVVESLRRSLEDLGTEGALVRNFTINEAQELALLGPRGEPRPEGLAPVARADAANSAEPRVPSSPMRRGPQRPFIEESPAAEAPSAQLWGLRELAPGYDKQLEFSQRGAAYTVAIPAGRLADLLARLELTEGHQAALRLATGPGGRSAPPAPGAAAAAHAWLHDYPLARAAIEDLRADPDAVIFLPVAVEGLQESFPPRK